MRTAGAPGDTVLGTLALWLSELRADDLSKGVAHSAVISLVDWMACTLEGANAPSTRRLLEALLPELDQDHAEIVPFRRTSSARTAALLNGSAAHASDMDDLYKEGLFHVGGPTIAAALAVGQLRGITGARLLTAIVAGYEVGTRLATALQPHHYKHWHTTGTVGAISSAAAAASALGLSVEQCINALAVGASMANGFQQTIRSDNNAKVLHSGRAAEAGVLAALAAERGFTGPKDILDGDVGIGVLMGNNVDWKSHVADLGQRYNIGAMTFKCLSCCAHIFPAVDATLDILRQRHALPNEISSIIVRTYASAVAVAHFDDPKSEYEARFSLSYCVASALCRGRLDRDAFSADQFTDADVASVAGKVQAVADPEFEARYPSMRGASVLVKYSDGTQLTATRPTRKGDPEDPFTFEELRAKWVAALTKHGSNAEAVLDRWMKVDTIVSVRDLHVEIEPSAAKNDRQTHLAHEVLPGAFDDR